MFMNGAGTLEAIAIQSWKAPSPSLRSGQRQAVKVCVGERCGRVGGVGALALLKEQDTVLQHLKFLAKVASERRAALRQNRQQSPYVACPHRGPHVAAFWDAVS